VLHADYLHTGGVVYDGEKPVGPLIFIVPTREATIIEGWDVIGLRATGSIDYSLDNVYVPIDCTHPHRPMIPNRGSDLFRIGIVGMAPLGHGAFALGVGRRVLDEAIRYATGPDGRPGTLNDRKGWGSFEEKYAVAEGKLRAGRAFLYEAFREVEASIERQVPVSNRQITHIKLALSTATKAAMDACDFVYRVGGGLSLRNSVVQRCLRDMLAASQHRIVSDFFLRECARELLGTAPGEVWTTAGLAAPS
jgi:alkylation response protein AidB-like acyl-CoA dehydrogenase